MSVINVWAEGRWSEAIPGLDKVYLIKTAIQLRLWLTSYEDAVSSLEGFEINGNPVSDKLEDHDSHYFADDIVDDELEKSVLKMLYRQLHLHQATFFVFPLDVLIQMKKKDHSLSAKYDQIISAAKVPIPTPKGYCVLLQFKDE